jgi:phage terminase large subunit-like protein
MFSIDDLASCRNILDCPSGASSFVVEVKEKYGINVIGCDPLFGDDLKRLFERGEADIEYVTQSITCC